MPFHISELLPCSKIDMSGIYFSDLLLNDGFVQICIWRSKTNQLGLGIWVMLRQYSAFPICPFRPAYVGHLIDLVYLSHVIKLVQFLRSV